MTVYFCNYSVEKDMKKRSVLYTGSEDLYIENCDTDVDGAIIGTVVLP
jgi:hypothetical protein